METITHQQLQNVDQDTTAVEQLQNFPPIETETVCAANICCAAYDLPFPTIQELMGAVKNALPSNQKLGPTPSTKRNRPTAAKNGIRPAAAKQSSNYPPLDTETRSHVETACASFHLTRRPQTLRAWACLENGPIRPIRINARLAWATADLKRLLNVGQ